MVESLSAAPVQCGGRVRRPARGVDQLRQVPVRIRPRDEVDLVVPVEQVLLQVLRHAAEDADGEVVAAQRALALQLLQTPVDLLVRLLADGAGINEHDVGAARSDPTSSKPRWTRIDFTSSQSYSFI